MASEKLIAFILKARQNKRSDAQISQQLLSVGWKQEAINDAFSEIKSKKIVAPTPAQAAKMVQAQAAAQPTQPAPTSPPWVKPDAAAAPVQPSTVQPAAPAQATAQPAPAQVSSAPQQPSSSPSEAAQTTQAPPSAPVSPPPQAQSTPAIPAPQPSVQSPIPPATPIQLPSEKKSLFSSLFGKKASQPQQQSAQPAAPAQAPSPLPQTAAAPAAQPTAPAARPPIFPPRIPVQSTLPQPAAPPVPSQGQSTLATFSGASSQPSSASTAPVAQQQPPASQAAAQPAPTAAPIAQQPSPAAQAQPSAGLMKLLPIIGLVALIAIAAGAFYIFMLAPASPPPPAPTPPITPPIQNITPSKPIQQAAGPIDCGSDMDCFIQASGTCKPAKILFNTSGDLFGMTVLSSTYMEIGNTTDAGKCSLYSSTTGTSVKFSNSMVSAALAQGATIDEITRQEAESTRLAQANVGLNGTCKYGAAALSAMLTRWKSGKFATSDYAGADCSGKRYANLQSSGGFSPSLTAPNFTSTASNASKTNTTAKANTTSANATIKTNTTAKTNATSANTSKTNANASTTSSANASVAANNSTAAKTYKFYRRYTTYYPEHLAWFCPDRKSEFYQMHWKEYFGGDCSVPKPKEGFVSYEEYVATGCTMLPCCVNGPYNEYSRSYDYFECGAN